jgi:hypothetical protein
MTDLLTSIKDDLTDRRLLPLVALVCVGLLGALAYIVIGGSSSSGNSSGVPAPVGPKAGLSVSQAQTSSGQALAETATGTAGQRQGAAHNPFAALPSPAKAKVATVTKSSPASSSSGSSGSSTPATSTASPSTGSGSSGSGGSSGNSTPPSPKPSAPAKPKKLYKVAVEFGPLPEPGAQNTQLPAYVGLSKPTPLPNAKTKLIEFLGVTSSGKSASFSLAGEAILHGQAACLPSATQCSMLDLKEGNSEQLEFVTPAGQVLVYELKVVGITSGKASTAAVASVLRAQSKLSAEGVLGLSGMRFGAEPGVIVRAARHHRG